MISADSTHRDSTLVRAGLRRTRPRLFGLLLGGFIVSSIALGGCATGGSGPELGEAAPPSRSGDGLLQREDLQNLVELQIARDGEALVERLGDPDAAVRARAAFALASVQDPDAVLALLELLHDPDPRVRSDAAFAVGLSVPGDGTVTVAVADSLLTALEREADPAVRRTLLEAVGRTGSQESLETLIEMAPPESDTAHAEAPIFAAALSRFGIRGIHAQPAVGWLVSGIHASSPDLREEAAYYFGRIPQPQFWQGRAPAVRDALDGYAPDDPAAMHLVRGLGTLADPLDQDRILGWIGGSPDWRIRTNAAQAAAAWRNEEAVRDSLFQALSDSSTHVAVTAAQALTRNMQLAEEELDRIQVWVRNNPTRWRVVEPFLAALGSGGRGDIILWWMTGWEEDAVQQRGIALEALALVADERVEPTLLEAARSGEPELEAAAMAAMARRWRIMRGDPAIRERYYEAFSEAVRRGNPGAVGEVAMVLIDPNFRELGAADVLVEAADRMSAEDDAAALVPVLEALRWVEADQETIAPVLREKLESPDPEVREAAAGALAAVTGEAVAAPRPDPSDLPSVDWSLLRELGPHPRMIFETSAGRVELVLDSEEAPLTVSAMAGYAREGRYDGVPFHRVLPNFVVQGGDFVREDGTGSPETTLRTELTRIDFDTGVIGMASAGKDTEGSQFYITHSKQSHLEGAYTSFGWVAEGMDVVGRINQGEELIRASVEPGG
ncbi:MAG: peptidylprolyl isomerase [Longimicrobiales bacterium]|nr:peptidylprolyl isomerase [Longimicrobiales bacterium]